MTWGRASMNLHRRVLEGAVDCLARDLARLHEPHLEDGFPVCHGCDRGTLVGLDPVWPCRTYTILASTILRIKDVESVLDDSRR
jgi:hypothetical protein